MKKYNIVITAGGTNEKIDEVRKITNMSTGALGVQILNKLLEQKKNEINKIYYLCSKHAKQPSVETLSDKVKIMHTESVSDMLEAITGLLTYNEIDYFIHSAAISDYTTDFVASKKMLAEEIEIAVDSYLYRLQHTAFGDPYSRYDLQDVIERVLNNPVKSKIDNSSKMSSKMNDPMISLKPTEKIISKIKELSPKTFLVGFKLLNSVSEEELFDVAFNLLRKNRCNLVLANDLANIRHGNHIGLLVYPEKKSEKVTGKETIAKTLVETMFKRGETRYPSSVKTGEENEIGQKIFEQFYQTGKKLFESGHLPIVENGTYGNMSIKNEHGFFITGRNVQKGNLTKNMLVKIENVEELSEEENKSSYTKVYYKGNVKPSIDTSIHHFLYKHTNYKAFLHIHTDKIFAGYPLSDYNYACGTEQEMLSILNAYLKEPSSDIIQMAKHGLIVMGESLNECLEKLNNLYENTISIEPGIFEKDNISYMEWESHLKEVGGGKGTIFDLENIEKYWTIEKNNETVGVLFLDVVDAEVQFVIYGVEKHRKTKLNIGENIQDILKRIAKTKEISSLKVITVDDCGVLDYYKEKLGFLQNENERNAYVLTKKI